MFVHVQQGVNPRCILQANRGKHQVADLLLLVMLKRQLSPTVSAALDTFLPQRTCFRHTIRGHSADHGHRTLSPNHCPIPP